MLSATQHLQPIDDYLVMEVRAKRIVGPLLVHLESIVQISSAREIVINYGPVVPKDKSVNDEIDLQLCSLTYASVEEATRRIITLGRGALYSVHIELAQRIAVIHSTMCGCTPCAIDFS